MHKEVITHARAHTHTHTHTVVLAHSSGSSLDQPPQSRPEKGVPGLVRMNTRECGPRGDTTGSGRTSVGEEEETQRRAGYGGGAPFPPKQEPL